MINPDYIQAREASPEDIMQKAREWLMQLHGATELGQRTEWIARALQSERSSREAEIEALRRELADAKAYSTGDWASQRENDHLTIQKYEWKARAEAAEAREAELRKALEASKSRFVQIENIIARNLYHQREKVQDARQIATGGWTAIDAALTASKEASDEA